MNTKIYLSLALAGMLALSACKKMDSTYKQYIVPNGIVYPGKATSAVIKPGFNRVEISWKRGADPKVVKAKIFWNNYTESVEVPVPADQDVISQTISNLSENFYTFIIVTYDKEGNRSVPVEISGNVWGERYRSTLLNRVSSSAISINNSLTINFEPVVAGSSIVKSEVEYTTTSGALKTATVLAGSTSVLLTDYKPGSSCKIRTQHFSSIGIDYLYTDYELVESFGLNKTEWKLVANSPFNSTDSPAKMWDGDPTTRWHAATTSTYPHFFTVDFGIVRTLKTVSLWRWVQPTADERGPNVVQFFGSLDNATWTDLGTYNFNRLINNEQIYNIPNLPQARYLMVKAISGPQVFVVLGEMNVTVK